VEFSFERYTDTLCLYKTKLRHPASGRAIELASLFQIFAALLIWLIVGRAHRQPEWQPKQLPYKFLRVHASTRSSAFSMFSIELATLNRK